MESLVSITGRPQTTDSDGTTRDMTFQEMRDAGWYVLNPGESPEYVHVLNGADEKPPTTDQTLYDGVGEVDWSALRGDHGNSVADAVLEAVWEKTIAGEKAQVRGRIGPAKAQGHIPSSLRSDLPPHSNPHD